MSHPQEEIYYFCSMLFVFNSTVRLNPARFSSQCDSTASLTKPQLHLNILQYWRWIESKQLRLVESSLVGWFCPRPSSIVLVIPFSSFISSSSYPNIPFRIFLHELKWVFMASRYCTVKCMMVLHFPYKFCVLATKMVTHRQYRYRQC